jgi:hypothetical protein
VHENYGTSRRDCGAIRIRWQDPRVAEHCAKVIIASNMDYEVAAAKIAPAETHERISVLAKQLATNVKVQKAIAAVLAKIGFDDKGFELFGKVLWEAILDKTNDKRWPGAMRIASEMFNARRAGERKPTPLPLQDLSAGLAKMGVGVSAEEDGEEIAPETFDIMETDDENVDEGV